MQVGGRRHIGHLPGVLDRSPDGSPPRSPAAPDGRIFSSERGGVVASTAIGDVWAEAGALGLPPEQFISPLATRPYDLRHAAGRLWLNAGSSPQDLAVGAGRSVDVLLRVYAKRLDDGAAVANRRIVAASSWAA